MLFTSFQADLSRTKAFARQILRATVARRSLSNFALGPNVCRPCPVHARRFSTTALLSPSYARKQWKAGLLDYLYQARQSVPNGLCTRERRADGQPVRRSNRVSVNSFVPRGILVFVIHSCVQYP